MPVWKEVTQHLRPTMLIGIGGSGKEVLQRIRRLFYERMGKRKDGSLGYPIIGYLALDTDPGSPNVMTGDSPDDFVLRNIDFQTGGTREFIDCSMSDPEFAAYFRNTATQFPHIHRWLSRSVERFGAAGAAAHGAGQNRQIARLCFFHHYRGHADLPGIRPTLEARLAQIMNAAVVPAIADEWTPEGAHVATNELDVILIYSLAGGTGAGMFLDMGILAREVVNKLGVLGQRAYFTHFVILPEPFLVGGSREKNRPQLTEEMKKKIQENCYGALREMEYFSLRAGQSFDLSLPPPVPEDDAVPDASPWYKLQWELKGETVRVESAPWDSCFLVGGSNDLLGAASMTPSDVFQMIADHIFLDFDPNQFATRRRMRRPNERSQVLDQAIDDVRDEGGVLYSHYVSRRFSSFGLSQIYFDRARMRRAAGCRLAVSLLNHWMQTHGLAPTMRAEFARNDLRGAALPGGSASVPLGFESIRDALMVIDRKTGQETWFQKVEEDAKNQRDVARNPALDPLISVAAVEGLLKKNRDRLQRNAVGGREGEARESIKANARSVNEEIERRLRELFLYRVDELGIPETLLLLEDYGKQLQGEADMASRWTQKKFQMNPVWKDRLDEARHLPNWPILRPAQTAAREELLRALDEAERYLKNLYTVHASEAIHGCLVLALRRSVGEGTSEQASRTGSYSDVLRRFLDLQGQTRLYLEQRFQELSKSDRGSDRTVGLLANWGLDAYDNEIRAFVAKKGDPRPFFTQVEERVLSQIRTQKSKEGAVNWEGVQSVGALILRLAPLEKGPPIKALVEDLARDLMNACSELLEGFCNDRRALDLFADDPDRHEYNYRVLRTYAAPFLRRDNRVTAAQSEDTVTLVQLGIADSGSPEAQQFRTNLIASDQGRQNLSRLEAFNAQNDAIVLCQEKHGIPLYYSLALEALGQAYYSSNSLPERHIDFNFLKDRLPEIRKIDQEKQKHLANCLEYTLQGIMTGVLRWNNGQFWLDRSTGSIGLPTPHPQGARLENMIHRYAENDSEREELERQVIAWVRREANSGDGLKLALLWCATDDLRAEINHRVKHLIQSGRFDRQGGADTTLVHPLEKILTKDLDNEKGLALRLRTRLESSATGSRWLKSKIDLQYLYQVTEDQDPQERQAALEEREKLLSPCFKKLPPELPIWVIQQKPALSLEAVQFETEVAKVGARSPRVVVVVQGRPTDGQTTKAQLTEGGGNGQGGKEE